MTTQALPPIQESNESRIRSTKRKLNDAFQVLDSAVNPSSTPDIDRPSPPKRANTINSLYSTLAKYGIKSGTVQSSTTPIISGTKSTPHLSAILARAALRTKHTFSFKAPFQNTTPAPPLPATAEYRPSSLQSFLSRLATYKLTTYANKPPSIDAVAASKCGWINDGKDRLVCGLCNASWVVAGREGLNRDAANTLVEKQRVSLVKAHKNGCPWKTRQCEDSIYCIPLQSPAAMIRDIKANAATMDPLIKDILSKHPLTTSQLTALRSTISSFEQPAQDTDEQMVDGQERLPTTTATEPSETAILASLFGWVLVPPAPPEPLRRTSLTRANSVASSTPATPPRSRASSVSLPRTPPKGPRKTTDFSFRLPNISLPKPENAMLQCELCQRRIGLWAFTARSLVDETPPPDTPLPPAAPAQNDGSSDTPAVQSTPSSSRPTKPLPRRAFDFLKEHRSYCPYIVRSTVVPSLPVPQMPGTPARSTSSNGHTSSSSLSHVNLNNRNGVLEGWRAVVTVVLRYGMAHKQRIEYSLLAQREITEAEDDEWDKMDVDNVKAMVNGVKSRGGRDLLRYVKDLLG